MPAGAEERDRRRREEEREREHAEEVEREHAERVEESRTRGGFYDRGDGTEVSDFDEGSADIPIWGWLSGASARRDAARNRRDQLLAQGVWGGLVGGAPSVEDLTADFLGEATRDEYGDLIGGRSAFEHDFGQDQVAAMDALRGLYESGGYTDGDMAASRALRGQQAMQLGAANQAALQQMQARGMGGSGAELAMRMGANDAMAYGNAQGDAAIQQAAMQRALQALQGYGSMANATRSADQQRMAALDAFNQSNMDWRRGRETRNTAWSNQTEQSRANAVQAAHENQERGVAGLTNQYQGAQQNRRADGARQDAANEAGANAIGTLLSELF